MSLYDQKCARADRDYYSLPINYARIHGEPMPIDLQIAVINLRAERSEPWKAIAGNSTA